MQRLVKAFFLTSALSTAVWAMPAFAQDISAGKEVANPEASRSLGTTTEFAARKSGPRSLVRSEGANRALGLDDAAAIKSFTIVSRSKDGTETRTAPSEEMLKALKGEKKAEADMAAPEGAADPLVAEESARAISGSDNRLPVKNATQYPYVAVGFLDAVNEKQQQNWGCTATVVGPSTILTAASCVYAHEMEGNWMEDLTFWPAINGEANIPFGGYSWVNMYVFEGFITNYDGTYDSIWPYDVALIELDTPIGDTTTGWLGFGDYPDLGDFEGNLIAYNDDVPAWEQRRGVCSIRVENMSEQDLLHDCDSDDNWSWGAPIYYFDQSDKSRRVVALNMGGFGDANWALRLHGPVYEWMLSTVK